MTEASAGHLQAVSKVLVQQCYREEVSKCKTASVVMATCGQAGAPRPARSDGGNLLFSLPLGGAVRRLLDIFLFFTFWCMKILHKILAFFLVNLFLSFEWAGGFHSLRCWPPASFLFHITWGLLVHTSVIRWWHLCLLRNFTSAGIGNTLICLFWNQVQNVLIFVWRCVLWFIFISAEITHADNTRPYLFTYLFIFLSCRSLKLYTFLS